jgi:hypothetical protein
MKKELKQLQEEIEKKFDEIFIIGDYSAGEMAKYKSIKIFIIRELEQTYKQVQKDLIEQDIKRLEGRKKPNPRFVMKDGEVLINEPASNSHYNQALEEEINYKKNNK